jgi:hypothetical protein
MDRIYRINKIQKVVRDALLINHANPVIMSKFADDLNVRSDPAANAPVLRPVLLQECLQELVTHHILAGLTCPFSHKARQVEQGGRFARVACLLFVIAHLPSGGTAISTIRELSEGLFNPSADADGTDNVSGKNQGAKRCRYSIEVMNLKLVATDFKGG